MEHTGSIVPELHESRPRLPILFKMHFNITLKEIDYLEDLGVSVLEMVSFSQISPLKSPVFFPTP